jgi:hypothetical protein
MGGSGGEAAAGSLIAVGSGNTAKNKDRETPVLIFPAVEDYAAAALSRKVLT